MSQKQRIWSEQPYVSTKSNDQGVFMFVCARKIVYVCACACVIEVKFNNKITHTHTHKYTHSHSYKFEHMYAYFGSLKCGCVWISMFIFWDLGIQLWSMLSIWAIVSHKPPPSCVTVQGETYGSHILTWPHLVLKSSESHIINSNTIFTQRTQGHKYLEIFCSLNIINKHNCPSHQLLLTPTTHNKGLFN